MNKMKMVVKKLALLTVTALPLTSLADIVTPAWDEKVVVPLFDTSDWRSWSVSATVFIVVVCLTVWIEKRRSISVVEYVVLEVMIGAAFAVAMYLFGGSIGFEERVIHHPQDDSGRRARYTCPSCGGPRSTWHGLCMKCEERSRRMTAAEKKFESAKHALLKLGVSQSQIDKAHDFWEKTFFAEWGYETDSRIMNSYPYDGACADIDDERYRLPYDIWVELSQAKTFVEGLARHGYNSKWCKDILEQIRRRLTEPEERRKRDEDQRKRDEQERIKQMCLECQRRLHFGKGQTCPLCLGTGLTKQKTLCHGCKGMGKGQFDMDIKGTLSDCGLNQ